jgi:hypothetical protein
MGDILHQTASGFVPQTLPAHWWGDVRRGGLARVSLVIARISSLPPRTTSAGEIGSVLLCRFCSYKEPLEQVIENRRLIVDRY